MMMKHPAKGAGFAMQPAPYSTAQLAAFAAFFVNDNDAQKKRPPRDCLGLALCREEDASGISHLTIRYFLQSGLDDYPLMVTQDAKTIIALWQGMGKDFSLPLYIRNEAGGILCVQDECEQTSYARRFGSPLSGRRPRFLARRKSPLKPSMV